MRELRNYEITTGRFELDLSTGGESVVQLRTSDGEWWYVTPPTDGRGWFVWRESMLARLPRSLDSDSGATVTEIASGRVSWSEGAYSSEAVLQFTYNGTNMVLLHDLSGYPWLLFDEDDLTPDRWIES